MSVTRPLRERRRFFAKVWGEAKSLLWAHRGKLAIGLALMVVNRLAGFVLPGSSKFLIDNVVGRGQTELLAPLALAVGATVSSTTSSTPGRRTCS